MRPSLALAFALLGVACGKREPEPPPALSGAAPAIVVHAVPRATVVALVVVFDVGGDHDPEGKSGLAHLVEHLYVTAAAGGTPARDAEGFMRAYPAGHNAQTGDRFTVIATVFPRDRLDAELREAAARMSALRIEAADLERERPRVIVELFNMYEGMPALAGPNLARERARPLAGARKGGVPEQVQMLALADVTEHWRRYYKLRNAVIAVAGDLDEAATRASILRAFAPVPAGEAPPPPRDPAPPHLGSATIELAAHTGAPELWSAWRAPRASDPAYPAFLALFGRLASRAGELSLGPARTGVAWSFLEDPDVLSLGTALRDGESIDGALARLDGFVAAAAGDGDGRAVFRALFADELAVHDPYLWAFSRARWYQLGLDPDRLRGALERAGDREIADAARLLAPDRRSTLVIGPR
jgi:zinc protease